MIFSLAACTTPKQQETAAKASLVEQQIASFGEITLQSRVAIEKAERAYNALDLDAKELVPNWYNIILAKEAYKQLRIQRIEDKVQAAQDAFDQTHSTWNLFYTLRDIIKDCHPDEEYIVKDAIAANEALCFEGTHFINFSNVLEADERIVLDETNGIMEYHDGDQTFSTFYAIAYDPYVPGERDVASYLIWFGQWGVANVWGAVNRTLDEHMHLYKETVAVLDDWGPEEKRGRDTVIYEDDLGSKLCYKLWSSGVNFYLQIYIKPAQPAES